MYTITYLFQPLDEPLNGRYIHAKGLHGFLFNITSQADREESDWLHKHPAPRPFALTHAGQYIWQPGSRLASICAAYDGLVS